MIKTLLWWCSGIPFPIDWTAYYTNFARTGRIAPTKSAGSISKHMVEAEGAAAPDETVIAEKAARRIADHRIGSDAGRGAGGFVEQRVIAPQGRAGARDRQRFARHLAAR